LVNGLLHHCQDLPGISGKLRPGIVHRLIQLEPREASGVFIAQLKSRYGVALKDETADPAFWLEAAAARHTSTDTARMAQRLLDDFRKSALGSIALELPG